MKVLFIGGTGIISSACTRLAVQRGIEVTIFHRGERQAVLPNQVHVIRGDINEAADHALLRKQSFDVVVEWVAYLPKDIERDIQLFQGRTAQYIFISSASAYQKPPSNYVITEATPLENPFWQYSRDKIACEERLQQAFAKTGFPITIVRPSLTYGESQIALAVNSWERSYTIVDRMRRGKEVIVPGDGSSIWVITHNTDFAKGLVGLLGNPSAIGEAFHITSDEARTWDYYYRVTAEAAGTEARLVHIASDFIVACMPEMVGTLAGDKAVSVVFENAKIKHTVPDYRASTSFSDGIRRTIEWFDADPARKIIDQEANKMWDKLIGAYHEGTQKSLQQFREN